MVLTFDIFESLWSVLLHPWLHSRCCCHIAGRSRGAGSLFGSDFGSGFVVEEGCCHSEKMPDRQGGVEDAMKFHKVLVGKLQRKNGMMKIAE